MFIADSDDLCPEELSTTPKCESTPSLVKEEKEKMLQQRKAEAQIRRRKKKKTNSSLAATTFKVCINVIEIEGLLLPGFGQMQAHKFPSSDIMSTLKFFQLKSSILSALVMSLDGKNRFSMECLRLPKPSE